MSQPAVGSGVCFRRELGPTISDCDMQSSRNIINKLASCNCSKNNSNNNMHFVSKLNKCTVYFSLQCLGVQVAG